MITITDSELDQARMLTLPYRKIMPVQYHLREIRLFSINTADRRLQGKIICFDPNCTKILTKYLETGNSIRHFRITNLCLDPQRYPPIQDRWRLRRVLIESRIIRIKMLEKVLYYPERRQKLLYCTMNRTEFWQNQTKVEAQCMEK